MPLNKRYIPDVHINLNIRGLFQSATLRINELSNKLIKEGKTIYKLGLGQSPFPVPDEVVEELKNYAHEKDYLPVMGLPKLREAIAEFHRKTQHVNCTSNDVLVGPGSKELMFILQLTYYGNLIVPTASWVSYAPQAHIIGRQIHWIETKKENGWRLTADDLNRFCEPDPNRPRILILNYPSNPTGASYSDCELKKIAKIARKYKIILLSDEIYGELHHDGNHTSIAQYYPEGTIISNGISKWCGAGGWRLGAFVFPESLHWLRDGMAVVASETFTSTAAPIQFAAIKAFEYSETIQNYISDSRKILKFISSYICEELRKVNVEVTSPDGGFYLFPNFDGYKEDLIAYGINSSDEFCERLLLEAGVAILPGSAFGRPINEFTTRLAFVDFDGRRALKAINTSELDESFMKHNCPNIIHSIKSVCDWLGLIKMKDV